MGSFQRPGLFRFSWPPMLAPDFELKGFDLFRCESEGKVDASGTPLSTRNLLPGSRLVDGNPNSPKHEHRRSPVAAQRAKSEGESESVPDL